MKAYKSIRVNSSKLRLPEVLILSALIVMYGALVLGMLGQHIIK